MIYLAIFVILVLVTVGIMVAVMTNEDIKKQSPASLRVTIIGMPLMITGLIWAVKTICGGF